MIFIYVLHYAVIFGMTLEVWQAGLCVG